MTPMWWCRACNWFFESEEPQGRAAFERCHEFRVELVPEKATQKVRWHATLRDKPEEMEKLMSEVKWAVVFHGSSK
jgi:hypothetical protein